MDSSEPESAFLGIPAELRNRIYELALYVPHTFKRDWVMVQRSEKSEKPSVLCLLQTCRQVYSEAKGIFYHINSLCVYRFYEFETFVSATGRLRCAHIRSLAIRNSIWDEVFTDPASMFQPLVRLETLEIGIYHREVWDAATKLLELVASLRGLKQFSIELFSYARSGTFTPGAVERAKLLEKEVEAIVCQPREELPEKAAESE